MKTIVLSMLAVMILGCASDQEPLTPRQQRALEVATQRAEQEKGREAAAVHHGALQRHEPGRLALPGTHANQPMSVSSLLKAGGRQLGAVELRELLKGAVWHGPLQGGRYRTQFRSDGRYQNTLLSHGEKNMDSYGYWYVDPQGRVCSQAASETAEPRCSFWFELRKQYYVGASNESSTQLVARKLIR